MTWECQKCGRSGESGESCGCWDRCKCGRWKPVESKTCFDLPPREYSTKTIVLNKAAHEQTVIDPQGESK